MRRFGSVALALAVAITFALPAGAQEVAGDQAAELAKKLANPVASLISLPFQYNYDSNFGPNDDGSKSLLNIQPVWPFSLGEKWNLITRTIVPVVSQKDLPTGTDKSGIGDVLQSFFFSPKDPVRGWILAVGPVMLYPTASDDVLGAGKWAAGPTALALKQSDGWTYGMLFNHVSSFAGAEDRSALSSTFFQPFLSYITKTKTTIGLNTESTYDWEREQWGVPLIFSLSQLVMMGGKPLSLQGGLKYWVQSPEYGPEGVGFRVAVTFLFPK